MVRERARGATIGEYIVLDRLLQGSSGVIYRAYKPDAHQRVAIKIFESEEGAAGRSATLDDARALAKISHPNVVAIHDVDIANEEVYLVMDLIEGRTLQRWLRRGHRRQADVVEKFVAAGCGLVAAHEAGRIHGEFDLAHALVDELARVRVVGFPVGAHAQVTDASPGYRPPEQHAGVSIDARVDQFSFSVGLWEGLHGRRPYVGSDLVALRAAIEAGAIDEPSPSDDVPPAIDDALRRGLSPDPKDRWTSLGALLGAIVEAREVLSP